MGAHSGPNAVEDGLVLALDASNPRSYPGSGTAWTDLGKNGYNGTLTNGILYSSDNNGSLSFDGSNEYVSLPDNMFTTIMDGTNPFTIEAAAYVTVFPSSELSTNSYSIFGAYGDRAVFLLLGDNGPVDSINIRTNINSVWNTTVSTSTIFLNTWNIVNVTYDPINGWKMYRNGILEDTSAVTGPITVGTEGNFIGAIRNYQRFFNGNISFVKIYNKELSAIEVQQNYNALKGKYGL